MSTKREITNYIIFGVLTTLINVTSYLFLTTLLGIDYKLAATIAWVLSVLFAFITNKVYVFQSNVRHFPTYIKEMGTFMLSRAVSYGLDISSMIILIEILRINDLGAKIIANFLVVVFNYLASKYFVFRQVVKE